jgi:hypothetical protein
MFPRLGQISLVLGLLLVVSWAAGADKKPADKSDEKKPSSDSAARAITVPGEIMKVLDDKKSPRVIVRVYYSLDTAARWKLLHHRDVLYRFDGEPVVRTKDVPKKEPKADGTPQFYTPEQLREMKGDPKLPGYPKELSDLKPGMVVELSVAKDANAAGTKPEDFLIRYVLIVRNKPEK